MAVAIIIGELIELDVKQQERVERKEHLSLMKTLLSY